MYFMFKADLFSFNTREVKEGLYRKVNQIIFKLFLKGQNAKVT